MCQPQTKKALSMCILYIIKLRIHNEKVLSPKKETPRILFAPKLEKSYKKTTEQAC
jgi:hypothetical protein